MKFHSSFYLYEKHMWPMCTCIHQLITCTHIHTHTHTHTQAKLTYTCIVIMHQWLGYPTFSIHLYSFQVDNNIVILSSDYYNRQLRTNIHTHLQQIYVHTMKHTLSNSYIYLRLSCNFQWCVLSLEIDFKWEVGRIKKWVLLDSSNVCQFYDFGFLVCQKWKIQSQECKIKDLECY